MQQHAQPAAYPPFHYPSASGDQNAQLLQGYGLPQQGAAGATSGGMFGAQSASSYGFDQSSAGYSQPSSVPVCQVGAASQMQVPPGAGAFAYPDFSNTFSHYASMGQSMPPGVAAMPGGLGDMQQFGPLMTNAFAQPLTTNGAILEAIAREQGLPGFNSMAFLQDPSGAASRDSTRGQRGGYSKYGVGRTNSNLPSVTNPDGLRDDTVFVSNLPQTIDHETMKAQFGVIGKIKINAKSGMPMVWIFKEKGIPKGEALVTYEDPKCVQSAISWFAEHEFLGRKIDVKQATNSQRPVIIPPGGGQTDPNMSGAGLIGPNSTVAAIAAAAVAAAASGNTMASLMNNSAAAAASLAALTGAGGPQFEKDFSGRGGTTPRGGRGGIVNGRAGGSTQAGSREGDWSCSQCGNINFSWREQCNRCQAPRSQDLGTAADPSGRNAVSGMPRVAVGPSGMPGVNTPAQTSTMAGYGRGAPTVNSAMSAANRGGRGGGPMRGSSVGVGRARPAPY